MSPQRELYHLRTKDLVRTVSLEPMENLTNYDDVPFELEREVRELLHQRYKLKLVQDNPDIRIRLTFKLYRRGTLREANNINQTKSLTAIAELKLFDKEGEELDNTIQSKTEVYQDTSLESFDMAENKMIRRLADQLVVDLLEP